MSKPKLKRKTYEDRCAARQIRLLSKRLPEDVQALINVAVAHIPKYKRTLLAQELYRVGSSRAENTMDFSEYEKCGDEIHKEIVAALDDVSDFQELVQLMYIIIMQKYGKENNSYVFHRFSENNIKSVVETAFKDSRSLGNEKIKNFAKKNKAFLD